MASKQDPDEFKDCNGDQKPGEAAGGISPAEMEMIKTLRVMGFEPKVGSVDDIARLASVFLKLKTGAGDEPSPPSPSDPSSLWDYLPSRSDLNHYPKFSIFYGEEGKGEVSWDNFQFEVNSVMRAAKFSEEQILYGLRHALKGSAGDKLRRLGTDVNLMQILNKFESAYGTIETQDSIMRKFYTCQQGQNETIESFASRLEDIHDKAVALEGLTKRNTKILEQVLYSGLRRDISRCLFTILKRILVMTTLSANCVD